MTNPISLNDLLNSKYANPNLREKYDALASLNQLSNASIFDASKQGFKVDGLKNGGFNTSIFDKQEFAEYKNYLSDGILSLDELNQIKAELTAEINAELVKVDKDPAQPGTPAGSTPAVALTPDQEIDPVKTAGLRSELKIAIDSYKDIKGDATKYEEKVNKAKDEIDKVQTELEEIVKQALAKAEETQKGVTKQVTDAVEAAKTDARDNKKDFKTVLGEKLAGIKVDGAEVSGLLDQADGYNAKLESLSATVKTYQFLLDSKNDAAGLLEKKYGDLLKIEDVNTVSMTKSGQIVIGQVGKDADGVTATGKDGITAADMASLAGKSESEIVKELGSNANLKAFADAVKAAAPGRTDAEIAKTIKNMIDTSETTDAKGEFGEFAGKVKSRTINGVALNNFLGEANKTCGEVKKPEPPPQQQACEPTYVEIDGQKYMFVRDRDGDGQFDGKQEILGVEDKQNELFKEVKEEIDINKDGNLTIEEMKAKGVSLVKVDSNEQVTADSYDLNNSANLNAFNQITNIDYKNNFREIGDGESQYAKEMGATRADNDGKIGTFAEFDVNLTGNRTAHGIETFEDDGPDGNNYFDKLLANDPSKKPAPVATSAPQSTNNILNHYLNQIMSFVSQNTDENNPFNVIQNVKKEIANAQSQINSIKEEVIKDKTYTANPFDAQKIEDEKKKKVEEVKQIRNK